MHITPFPHFIILDRLPDSLRSPFFDVYFLRKLLVPSRTDVITLRNRVMEFPSGATAVPARGEAVHYRRKELRTFSLRTSQRESSPGLKGRAYETIVEP